MRDSNNTLFGTVMEIFGAVVFIAALSIPVWPYVYQHWLG